MRRLAVLISQAVRAKWLVNYLFKLRLLSFFVLDFTWRNSFTDTRTYTATMCFFWSWLYLYIEWQTQRILRDALLTPETISAPTAQRHKFGAER
jgi:hypothetical protein